MIPTQASRPLISLIIPAYDESTYITGILETADNFFKTQGWAYEVIVVDDGSRDDTVALVESFASKSTSIRLLRHSANLGKGAAVRTGMLNASGEYLIFTDADLSYAIEDVGVMLSTLSAGAEVALGSRTFKGSETLTPPPMLRLLLSKVFSLVVQIVAIKGISDTQCGFKGFTRVAASDIFRRLTITGFAFDVEVLVIARNLGCRIDLVPVHYIARETSKVRVLRDSLRMLGQLFRIRANEISGLYKGTGMQGGQQGSPEIGLPRGDD